MKKKIAIILCLAMIFTSLYGCGAKTEKNDDNTGKIKIVTTIFPVYEWVREIIGEDNKNIQLTMLLDKGVDLHSYQPTAEDIKTIKECDMLVYVGGESDSWIEDAIGEATNKNMEVVNLMDLLGDSKKAEEMVEGMEKSEHHHHNHDEDHHDEHHDADHDEDHHDEHHDTDHDKHHEEEHHHHDDGDIEYDEHIWLSLKNAKLSVEKLVKVIEGLDKENESKYQANGKAFIEKLNKLDMEYEKTVKESNKKTLIFGDRFPFRYLVDDYHIDYYAAFIGCSAETEASLNTILFLANKLDELKLHSIMTIEGRTHTIAETVIENSKTKDIKILTLDSMQSTTKEDVEKGANYIQIMRDNLKVIKEALK